MKRLLILLLLLPLIFVGCAEEQEDRFTVVATLFPQYDFARNVAGDRVDVELLLDLGTDAHSYDPTPLDVIKIATADLFIYTGDGMELWVKKLLESADVAAAIERGDLTVLDLSKQVDLICTDSHDHDHDHGHDHGHGHDHAEYDPHIWTSPENAIKMCGAIADTLIALDGDNAAYYSERLDAYTGELALLCEEIGGVVTGARLDTVHFGGSFAFAYLFDYAALKHVSVYEGCASHAEPSAADITGVVRSARESGAKYIVYDTEPERKVAATVAEECGAELIRMHAIHNVSKKEVDSGEDYISLMYRNSETLRKAIS